MKTLTAFLLAMCLVACGPAPAPVPVQQEASHPDEDGCTVDSGSKLMNQHQVGPIRNLHKEVEENGITNKCTVEFDITVDGNSYHLKETEEGMEQTASICYYARERAREDLLLDLGGTFKSESSVSCKLHERN